MHTAFLVKAVPLLLESNLPVMCVEASALFTPACLLVFGEFVCLEVGQHLVC